MVAGDEVAEADANAEQVEVELPAVPTAVEPAKLDYTVAKMALALSIDARDVRRNLRALFGKLPSGVRGWSRPNEAAFAEARDAVRVRIKASAK